VILYGFGRWLDAYLAGWTKKNEAFLNQEVQYPLQEVADFGRCHAAFRRHSPRSFRVALQVLLQHFGRVEVFLRLAQVIGARVGFGLFLQAIVQFCGFYSIALREPG